MYIMNPVQKKKKKEWAPNLTLTIIKNEFIVLKSHTEI